MATDANGASARRRDDIFVSIGLIGTPGGPFLNDALRALIGRMNALFHYWELLFVIDADDEAMQQELLAVTQNLRLLKVRRETPGFRRRLSIASEAIGDLLIISALEELDQVDLLALAAQCESSEALITVRRSGSAFGTAPMIALGRSAGFHVDSRDMVTAAYPRAILNRLLKHPDAPLALRFPPTDRNIPTQVNLCTAAPAMRAPSSARHLFYRLGILQQILVSSAPRVLGLVEILSLLVALSGGLFIVYAVVVELTFAKVQPGWFTTSVMLSMTATFLGLAIFGLSMGIQRLLDLATGARDSDVIEEVNPIDLFRYASHELNIELDAHRAEAGPDA
jgi:hypothetical protein